MQVLGDYLYSFVKSSSDAGQVSEKTNPEIFGVIAFFKIATHQWTQPQGIKEGEGTKYNVSNGRLYSMPKQDYQIGSVNFQGVVRTAYNLTGGGEANHDALCPISKELKRFIHWYCFNPDQEFSRSAREFLKKYLKPGLVSMKSVYKGSTTEGQIKHWIKKIKQLDDKLLHNKKPLSEYEERLKNLLTKEHLTRVNNIFQAAYNRTYNTKHTIDQIEDEIDLLHQQFNELRKVKLVLQKNKTTEGPVVGKKN